MTDISELFQNDSKKIIDGLMKELSAVRGNRPNPLLVENIRVNYFNQELPLKQLGSIRVIPPREIEISVWDPNAVQLVSRAVEESKSGFSVRTDGSVVRVHLPELSEERRKEISREVKAIGERSKISLRRLRDEINKKINDSEKNKEIREDEAFKLKKQVQETTEEKNGEMEKLLTNKLKEINN